MKKQKYLHKAKHLTSGLLILLLLWLTVSLPAVYSSLAKQTTGKQPTGTNDQNPLSDTAEEKGEETVDVSQEYIHPASALDRQVVSVIHYYKGYPLSAYSIFPPELVAPPPEA